MKELTVYLFAYIVGVLTSCVVLALKRTSLVHAFFWPFWLAVGASMGLMAAGDWMLKKADEWILSPSPVKRAVGWTVAILFLLLLIFSRA